MTTQHTDQRIAPVPKTWRELDSRTNDGLQVSLLWRAATDEVRVAVIDARAGQSFEFDVDGVDARAAFNHPFSYAPTQNSSAGAPPITHANPDTTGARHVTR